MEATYSIGFSGKTAQNASTTKTLKTGSELSQSAGNALAKLYDKVTTNTVTKFTTIKKTAYDVE